MAFQLAIMNGISHPFSGKDKKAGWKWFKINLYKIVAKSLKKE
jgi:hypothetical protein